MQYSFKVLIIAVLAMFSSAPLFAQKMEPDATVKYADRVRQSFGQCNKNGCGGFVFGYGLPCEKREVYGH